MTTSSLMTFERIVAETFAERSVHVAFRDRSGHGGARASERHLSPQQLRVIVQAAIEAALDRVRPSDLADALREIGACDPDARPGHVAYATKHTLVAVARAALARLESR